ncbi:MAG TPA: trehalose-phosphatase [Silvibacterium sp.]|nr:trehalose-phosphatase [Silvibacterium sp.]
MPGIHETTALPDSATLLDFFDQLSTAPASVLLLDYDGTLAPFQMERDRAYPYPKVIPLLESILQRSRTRVVVITGRPVAELEALLSPLNHFEAWGAHGLERMLPDGSYEQISIDRETLELLSKAKQWVNETGLTSLAEIKPGGIAIHWRGMTDAEIESVEARVRKGWTPLAQHPQLKLLKFESGLELRVAHPDKGDAVVTIIDESDAHTPIAYLGDDLTDEDSFRVLNGRGLTVLVRPEHRETLAKVWLRPPHELIGFLEQWLSRVPRTI